MTVKRRIFVARVRCFRPFGLGLRVLAAYRHFRGAGAGFWAAAPTAERWQRTRSAKRVVSPRRGSKRWFCWRSSERGVPYLEDVGLCSSRISLRVQFSRTNNHHTE